MIKITESHYNYLRSEYFGICLSCKHEQDSCEPDAENYRCEECGTLDVQGIENLLVMGLIELTESEESNESHE